jgi:SOS-response transcriptional repressor LexA
VSYACRMKPNLELTTGEKEVLRHYLLHCKRHGAPPTIRQLCEHMGSKNPNTAQGYLKRLQAKGYLEGRPVTVIRFKLTPKAKKVAL